MKYSILDSTKTLVGASLLAALAACGGGGGADDPGQPGGDPVASTLAAMGVDTSPTARVDDDGDPLPETYSPLGSRRDFSAIRELLLLGPSPASVDSNVALYELAPDQLSEEGNQIYDQELLFAMAADDMPWAEQRGDARDSLRAATRADLNRDGLDELVIGFWDRDSETLSLQVYDDQEDDFAAHEELSLGQGEVSNLALASGDVDGDGYREVIVATGSPSGAEIWFVENQAGALASGPARQKVAQMLAGSDIDVALALGNLDTDGSDEIVLVVNEYREAEGSPAQGSARYRVFDDAASDYALLASAQVSAAVDGVTRSAVSADVAVGDIDGDAIDEIVFAGLTHFDPDGDCDYRYLLIALDDAKRELALLGAREQDVGLTDTCKQEAPLVLRYVHVNTFDLDGDGYLEIQANRFVYDDFVAAPPFTAVVDTELDPLSLYAFDEGYTGRFDRDNSAIVTGDLSADEREDVVFYSQATHTLEVWGIAEPMKVWAQIATIPLAPIEGDEAIHPVLVTPNVNADGLALSYDDGAYQLVFTEPIIIAALAAPPCYDDRGQNLFSCRTQYGTAESETTQIEDTLTVTASASVGFESEFSLFGAKIGASVVATLETHLSQTQSKAYTLTKRISYTTGPNEDSVIFTTIPYDQYTYTILSHPEPELVGSRIVISLPRTPVDLQVSREFYNQSVEAGGFQIDELVFAHQTGDPTSYPSATDKDALLSTFDGYSIGPQAVGEGGGNESLGINISTETGSSVSWGISQSRDVRVTAGGVIGAFSIGAGVDSSLSISHGRESSYVGSVSNLPSENFASDGYQFGLFTYIYDDADNEQQFEVINYWVE